MRRHITYDIVKTEFEIRGYELVSTSYIGYDKKLQYICPKHRDKGVLEMTFANFTKGRNCPYCSHRHKRNTEEYQKELFAITPDIEVLEEYQGLKVKIKHKCKVCQYEWQVTPTNLLHLHQGCPKCHRRHYKRTQEEFIKEVAVINPDIIVLGTFVDVGSKIDFQCSKCGNIWQATPNNILFGKGCPHCKNSYGDIAIKNWLEEHNIKYYKEYCFEDCKNFISLPFDFYIPSFNMCIEYDGLQHFQPCRFGGMPLEKAKQKLVECQYRDNIKTEYCINNNIKLLRIPYTEYNNIDNILSLNFN